MDSLRAFQAAFEKLGYRRWDRYPTFHPRDVWYFFPSGNPETFHVAYFRHQPRVKSYGIQLGAFNSDELLILERHRSLIARQNSYSLYPPSFPMMLPWMLFIPESSTGVNLLSIPNIHEPSSWKIQLEFLKDIYLAPIFWPIRSPEGIFLLLYENSEPFRWEKRNFVLRAAQLIALGKIMKFEPEEIQRRLFLIIESNAETLSDQTERLSNAVKALILELFA